MTERFITEDFLLQSNKAKSLYHDYAEKMPIYDFHCHLPAKHVADDVNFENITQIWLAGDHYKWRAMRANGIAEKYCTGNASDYEKFEKWAATVPYCLRNPLYHWTHLELVRIFGIDKLLNPETAKSIYNKCTEKLQTPDFSARNIMRKMNVKLVCTTDDPLDSLEHHKIIREDGFEISVHAAWRPDKCMATEDTQTLNKWIDRLAELVDIEIADYQSYIEALKKRHEYFHSNGCRLSDHGLDVPYAEDYTQQEIESIFSKIRSKKALDINEQRKFKSAMLVDLAVMDHEKGWVQQFHIGALRNTNSRMFKAVGPDTGFDTIDDQLIARPLAKFLDRLTFMGKLAKTVLYNLNSRDNEMTAAMCGNFQDGSTAGKIQFGPGWWFLDQLDGMTKQIDALSNLGLLSRFVGMTTDSRSFLSYPRHEYFRRLLCNILGDEIEKGMLPNDMQLIGAMVQNICYNNARNYFGMQCD